LTCPICHKRKAARFCPARSERICAVCCATEREVTIDCPSDCSYLMASRQYEDERREVDWSNMPFADVKVPPSVFSEHAGLMDEIVHTICAFAAGDRAAVDSDVLAALRALAEAYQTLAKGIYYEKPPHYGVQRQLYTGLKSAIAEYKKEEADRLKVLGDETIRDALIFFSQLAAMRANGRPKGRAFLDFLRSHVEREDTAAAGSPLLIVP
jgi:hypothetical protein